LRLAQRRPAYHALVDGLAFDDLELFSRIAALGSTAGA